MARLADLTGQRFGRWVVRWPAGIKHSGKTRLVSQVKRGRMYSHSMRSHTIFWLCVCNCGALRLISRGALVSGGSKSCGCLKYDLRGTSNFRHGAGRSGRQWAEYKIYMGAKARCRNQKNTHYRLYGGRGIKFLFSSFPQFLDHVGRRPSPDHSLDRIDNDRHYEIGNVRWATAEEQIHNRRVKYLKDFSTEQILAELARRQA
jgi:hypothetical protein